MDAPLTNAIPQIEALARQTLDRYRLPGIALGIVRDGGLAWFGGYGRADLDRAEPPSADSLARVASVTKTFTATAIVQLRDAGKLALDDPLVQHIPEFSQVQVRAGTLEGVTLRRMLTHRAGLATESPIDGWGALRFPTRDEVLAALHATEVVIQQDNAWKYSNLYRSPHLPPQNPLVGWDNPPAVVALGVDGETSRPRPTAPPQPAALSRHSRAQCPPSQPGRTRPAVAPGLADAWRFARGVDRPPRISWAALLARVFALDVTRCPACGGRLRLVAALTDPASIQRYLHGVGLPTQPPPLKPPRPPPQQQWDFAA